MSDKIWTLENRLEVGLNGDELQFLKQAFNPFLELPLKAYKTIFEDLDDYSNNQLINSMGAAVLTLRTLDSYVPYERGITISSNNDSKFILNNYKLLELAELIHGDLVSKVIINPSNDSISAYIDLGKNKSPLTQQGKTYLDSIKHLIVVNAEDENTSEDEIPSQYTTH